MTFWNPNQPTVNYSTPDDGLGDSIRDSFIKVDNYLGNISLQLGNPYQDWNNANVQFQTNLNYTNVANLFVANATGNTASFVGNITSGTYVNAGNVTTTGNLISGGTTYLLGATTISGDIVPSASAQYNLGSSLNPFKTLYVQTTVSTSQLSQTTSAGLLQVHEGAPPTDQQDVGVFGNIAPKFLTNTYAFFGHQYATDNFVYKITNTDTAKSGNSVVYDGVYGNVQFGSQFLSNATLSTSTSTGALIVKGGTGIGGNLNVGGNAVVGNNMYIAGSYASIGGYQVLTTNTPGLQQYSGSAITQLVITGANPATALDTGSLILDPGGASIRGDLVLGGNVTGIPGSYVQYYLGANGYASFGNGATTINSAGTITAPAFVGTLYGTLSTSASAQPNITSVGTLGSLQVGTSIAGASLLLSGSGVSGTPLTVLSGGANITGAVTVTGTIASSGNITAPWFVGNTSGTYGVVNTLYAGTVLSSGSATVQGNLNASANLIVSGNAYANTNLIVTTNSYIGGTLSVTGNTYTANLNTTGTAQINNLVVTNLESVGAALTTPTLNATTVNVGTVNATNLFAPTVGNVNSSSSLYGVLQTATQANLTTALNLTSVGTITAGTWRGSVVATTYGGTGVAGTLTGIGYMNGASAFTVATASQISTALSAASPNTQAPTLLGTNFSGTAGSLNIGGYAQYIGNSSGYYAPQTPGTAPNSAQVLVSNNSGYAYLYYINSSSPNAENPNVSQVIVTNGYDGFYRKSSLAQFTGQLTGTASSLVAGLANGLKVGQGLYPNRTDSAWYQICWNNANQNDSNIYSSAAVLLNSNGYGAIGFNGSSWYIQGNNTYGLYSNTGFNANGGLWDSGNRVITTNNIGSQSVNYATTAGSAGYLNNTNIAYTNGSDGWFRSPGNAGWYNSSYAGGVFMQDSSWVRTYPTSGTGVGFYVGGSNGIAAAYNVIAYYSDERLKTKVGKIENALDKVKSLSGFYYVENDLAKSLGYDNKKQQVALSAQAVQSVMPEAVSLAPFDMTTDEATGEIVSKSGENYLTVQYERLVPLLVEAINELGNQLADIKKHLGI